MSAATLSACLLRTSRTGHAHIFWSWSAPSPPWDALERTHLTTAARWLAGGAPVYRVRKPDVSATHLICYFVVRDDSRGRLLLVAHRKAGLWLPAGGHVEPGEGPGPR
ncbi:hypothetical protein AB0N92_35590 [Streptomyces sp. NPDC093248]|uniref:hypothetical protein n=1 Tax=Streptomyces sp. NPDC093248 TaxID=3155072 RepID=UPI003432AD80